MLTDTERVTLAEWMGWTLRMLAPKAKMEAWHDGTDYVMLPEHWQPDTNWRDAGLLLEQLRAQKVEIRLDLYLRGIDDWFVDLLWRDDAGNCAGQSWGRERGLPLAVCRAILDMLEASE